MCNACFQAYFGFYLSFCVTLLVYSLLIFLFLLPSSITITSTAASNDLILGMCCNFRVISIFDLNMQEWSKVSFQSMSLFKRRLSYNEAVATIKQLYLLP